MSPKSTRWRRGRHIHSILQYAYMLSEEEQPTRLQQTLHPRMGQQLQLPPSRAPAGHHQGRHRHNGNITTPEAGWSTQGQVDWGSGVCGLHTFKSQCVADHKQADRQKHDALWVSNNCKCNCFPDADRDFACWTSREVTSLSRAATAGANLSSDFTVEELEAAIKQLKSGKAPGRDNIHPEFVIHQSAKTTAWLC